MEKILFDSKNDMERYMILLNEDGLTILKYLIYIKDKDLRLELINNTSDQDKIKYLDDIFDNKKVSCFNQVNLFNIIFYIKDKDIRVKYFNKLFLYDDFIELITNYLDEDSKIKFLYFINDSNQRIKILLSLSDQNKIKYLYLLKDEEDKIKILESIKDKDLIKELILDNEYYDKNNIPNLYTLSDHDLPSDLSIGIEIETEEGNANLIRIYGKDIIERWKVKEDTSLSLNNVEVNSPILYYNQDDLNELVVICKFLKDNKVESSERCGLHIHLGLDYLDTKESLEMFYKIYTLFEDEITLMAQEEGVLPRKQINVFAKKITPNIERALERRKDKFLVSNREEYINNIIKYVQVRYNYMEREYVGNFKFSVCLREYNTMEFRISNSTLDPYAIIENIKLFGKLFILSKKMSKLDKNQINNILNDLDQDNKVLLFLELLFDNKNDIDYFYNRYITNNNLMKMSKKERKLTY